MSDENSIATLEKLQQESFNYFVHETNPANGLVIDKNEANWPASITATGLALAAYPVAVERGFMPRAAAGRRTLNILAFSGIARKGPNGTPPATKDFIIISSMRKVAGTSGSANCQQSKTRFC